MGRPMTPMFTVEKLLKYKSRFGCELSIQRSKMGVRGNFDLSYKMMELTPPSARSWLKPRLVT